MDNSTKPMLETLAIPYNDNQLVDQDLCNDLLLQFYYLESKHSLVVMLKTSCSLFRIGIFIK